MKKLGFLLFVLLAVGAWWVYGKYASIYQSNVSLEGDEPFELLISSDMDYSAIEQVLIGSGILEDADSFIWVAEQKSYPSLVKTGRYLIKDGMTNNELVNMLRIGEQAPVKLSFNNARNIPQLAGKLARSLEPDSMTFLRYLTKPDVITRYGFTPETFICMFIPNTYEVYWNTKPDQLVSRMAAEFKSFWTDARKSRANAIGLSQSEVVTLASIVQAEQSIRPQEWPTIAGLYLNRLKKGMKLESDPTLIFAVGDFSIRRVLNKHKKVESRYNTYMHTGLPPGPIRMPDIGVVDAVLNHEDHKYIFMCAKADLSGYHHFSETLRQHNRYAREYRQAMNENKIYK